MAAMALALSPGRCLQQQKNAPAAEKMVEAFPMEGIHRACSKRPEGGGGWAGGTHSRACRSR